MDDPQSATIHMQISLYLFLFLLAQVFVQPQTLNDGRYLCALFIHIFG